MTTHRIKTPSAIYLNILFFLYLLIAIFVMLPNTANAGLSATPPTLDFGDVNLNSNSTLSVTVTNTGSQDISNIVATIADIAFGAYNQTGNCVGAILLAGETCTILVIFSPLVAGLASDNLSITGLEGGEVSVFDDVSLIGVGIKGELTASPATLDFGDVPVNSQSAVQQVTISNPGNGVISLETISISGEFSQTNTCDATLAAGESCIADITYNPLTAGNAVGTLDIFGTDTDGVTPLSATVSIAGNGIKGELTASPTTLDFGGVPVNSQSAIQQVTISNPGSGVISLETISISGEFSQTNTCGQTLAANDSCIVDITYNPLTAGNVVGSLDIFGTDTDGVTPLNASVSLAGFGELASLSLTPGTLDFGVIEVGTSSNSQEVMLTNTGTEPLAFTSVTITGEFSGSDNCSATINPGESCIFDLIYQPLTEGDAVGSLDIIMHDINNQTDVSATVTLTGSTVIDRAHLEELLLSYAGNNPSVRSTAIVIADTCTSGRASERLQEDCNALIQAAESGDEGTSRALLEITPERAIKASRLIHQAGLTQLANTISRILELRNGARGFSMEGFALNVNDQLLAGNHLSSLINAGDTGGGAGSEEGVFGSKWGGFITGTVTSGDKDSTSLESGLDFRTKGILAGLDYRFSDQFVVGGAIGYVKTDTDLDNDGGELDSDGYSLTAYGTYYEKDYFVDFSMTYGSNDFDQERLISYQLQNQGSTSQLATASYDGDMLTLFVAGGYDFNYGSWMLGPRLSLEYIDTDVDDFTEKMSNPGGSGAGWATRIDDTDQQWLTFKLGGKVSYAHSTSWGVLTPYAGIDWLHEFKNDSQVINGNFIEDPGSMSFNLYTEDPDEDYFQLTVGVSAVLPGGMIGYLNYDTILSNDLWSRDTINAGIRMEF